MTGIETYLRSLADVQLRAALDRIASRGWRFGSLESLVLEQGRAWTAPVANPWELDARPRECFNNCFLAVVDNDDLEYVEGWAMSPQGFVVHHAWLVELDGTIHDPTWAIRYAGDVVEYCGVQFATDFLDEEANRVGYPSQLCPNNFVNTRALEHGYELDNDGVARRYALLKENAS